MGNATVVEGLIARQAANGDIFSTIHINDLVNALQSIPPNKNGCITLHFPKRVFIDQKKGYTHAKPMVKISHKPE